MKKALWKALAASTIVVAMSGCESQQKTEALVKARLDAEKVQELSTELETVKAERDSLQKEAEELKLQLTEAKAAAESAATAAATATLPKPQAPMAQKEFKKAAAASAALKLQNEEAKRAAEDAATGGDSFK